MEKPRHLLDLIRLVKPKAALCLRPTRSASVTLTQSSCPCFVPLAVKTSQCSYPAGDSTPKRT